MKKKGYANNSSKISGFTPNRKQKQVGNLLRTFPLVFVSGVSGTGKTSGVLHHFCTEYLSCRNRELIIIRTPVEAGRDSIGYLKGDMEDKTAPHKELYKEVLKEFLGNKFEVDVGKYIHFRIPNFELGKTYHNAMVLIDEAQQIEPDILKMLLERLGENTVCAVVGDPSQIYSSGKRNGLTHAINKFFQQDGDPMFDNVASFEYEVSDNVRSDISRTVCEAYQ